MKRVVTFGEIMLRLAPEGYARFVQAERFGAVYGGGEANVAVSLANFGIDAAFVTKLPCHEIGQAAVNSLRRYGVDTRGILRGGDRLGIYFLEQGASQRPSKVIYDRAGSAFALAQPEEYDWKRLLEGADWFYFTGITPALGERVAQACLQACRAAKELGLTVGCDLNYRMNLWSRQEAERVMTALMPYVDVCISSEANAADVFGIRAESGAGGAGQTDPESCRAVARELAQRFGFAKVAVTRRGSISASDNDWAAMLYDGGEYYYSRNYHIHIVDRIGGGDSFGAGLIYSQLMDFSPQESIEFAAAASCLKHTVEGDCNLVSVQEVQLLAGGDGSGRVQR